MMGVWFLAVTAGDATTGLLAIAGVDLNKTGIVAFQAVLAVAAAPRCGCTASASRN